MTEITGNIGGLSRPWFRMRPTRATQLIDPVAFFGALIGAPLLIALLFFWVLLIPVVAVVLGAIPYLVLGMPTYIWLLSRGEARKLAFALSGLILNLFAVGLIGLTGLVGEARGVDAGDVFELVSLYSTLGSVFAALWSATFIHLYLRFRRGRFLPNQI